MKKSPNFIKKNNFSPKSISLVILFSISDWLFFELSKKKTANSTSHNVKKEVVQKCAIPVVKRFKLDDFLVWQILRLPE